METIHPLHVDTQTVKQIWYKSDLFMIGVMDKYCACVCVCVWCNPPFYLDESNHSKRTHYRYQAHLSLGIPRVTFISPRPAKWNVLSVIWVDGSPTDYNSKEWVLAEYWIHQLCDSPVLLAVPQPPLGQPELSSFWTGLLCRIFLQTAWRKTCMKYKL